MDELHFEGVQKCQVEQDGCTLLLANLVVREGQRGQGVGTRVVERVKDLARRRGCRWLTVYPDPRSEQPEALARFWKRHGFRPRAGEVDGGLLVCVL